MKKIFIFLPFLLLCSIFLYFVSNTSYSNDCKYEDKINECIKENKNWQANSVEDFLCISSSDKEKIIYNLILDQKFSQIDNEIEEYIYWLERNKDYYFWENKKQDFISAIDEIYNKFKYSWTYYLAYKDLCSPYLENSIVSEALSCLWDETSINNSQSYFKESDCMALAETKLIIYSKIANDVLRLNKQNTTRDSRKDYVQKQRKNYDLVSRLFLTNLSYLERIWMKWPAAIKNPY